MNPIPYHWQYLPLLLQVLVAFGMGAGSPFSVTATFGVAESEPDVNAKELMESADRALYQAKSAGRNRVIVNA